MQTYEKINNNIHRELFMETDSHGVITAISSNCYNVLGYNTDEIIGVDVSSLIINGKIEFDEEVERNFELTLKNKNGQHICFDGLMHSIKDYNNQITGAQISLIDTSRIKYSKEKQEKLLNILELSKDIIYMVELKPEEKIIYINSAVEEVIGIDVEKHYQNPSIPFEMTHPDDKEKFTKKVNGEVDYSKPIQARYKNVNGEYIWFEESTIPIYDEQSDLVAVVGFCRNIQERKELEENLRRVSYYDSLTEIKNRTYFQKEMDNLNTQVNKAFGIIICDLDNLKDTNDRLGHLQGDTLLKEFAKILDNFTSENLVVARIGGDEFALLLRDVTYNFVENIYFRLIKSIESYNANNINLPIRVSIGFAYSKTSLGMTRKIYSIADSKMYKNKKANKKI